MYIPWPKIQHTNSDCICHIVECFKVINYLSLLSTSNWMCKQNLKIFLKCRISIIEACTKKRIFKFGLWEKKSGHPCDIMKALRCSLNMVMLKIRKTGLKGTKQLTRKSNSYSKWPICKISSILVRNISGRAVLHQKISSNASFFASF